MEVMLDVNSEYETVVKHAAATLNVDEEEGPIELLLFRVDGTVIPNNDLDIDGCSKKWTLGRYMKSQVKTPSQLKLSVGYRYLVSYWYIHVYTC